MNVRQPSLGIIALVVHARQVSSEAREQFAAAAAAPDAEPAQAV
jgi:hypothetical protein